MLDSPGNNFGWFILGNESEFQTARRFDSSESFNPPVLSIEFEVPGAGIASDFDGDDDVDGDDLDIWSGSFGTDTGGDADADGDTDGSDFLVWQNEFTGPTAGLAASVVPEPTAMLLAMTAVLCFTRNHRRCVARA